MHKFSPSEVPEDSHLFRLDASGSEAADLDSRFLNVFDVQNGTCVSPMEISYHLISSYL